MITQILKLFGVQFENNHALINDKFEIELFGHSVRITDLNDGRTTVYMNVGDIDSHTRDEIYLKYSRIT